MSLQRIFTQRLIKVSLLISFVILTACKKDFPKVELCGYHKASGKLVCNDKRSNPNDYERDINNGDLVTSPESFERAKAFCYEVAKDLVKCERKKK